MFYAVLCHICLTGLTERRFGEHDHPESECAAFCNLRKRAGLPADRTLDQTELRAVLEYERRTGKLPETTVKGRK